MPRIALLEAVAHVRRVWCETPGVRELASGELKDLGMTERMGQVPVRWRILQPDCVYPGEAKASSLPNRRENEPC
ncbi:MAG: hypothetical protein ACE5EC_03955 [Phycisphaerae bacterium]